MVKIAILMFCFLSATIVNGQSLDLDAIDFYNDSLFAQKVHHAKKGGIDYVEFTQKGGKIRKVDYYNRQQRIVRDKIWLDTLIREVKYTYFENGLVIKRFDVLNNVELPTQVNANIRYPATARERGVEGDVKMKITFDNNCIPSSVELLSGPGDSIKKEVRKKMKRFVELHQKYKVVIEDCESLDSIRTVQFRLEG